MAKSKSGEFYSFDEVLRQLNVDENRLKRLVSEGEIRAFREGGQMKFKRSEIDGLAGRAGRGSQTSETSLTEISLDDDSQPTVNVGGKGGKDTLSDDLLAEPDLRSHGGMRTAEISSQDTFIDQGDVGMSTEPIDFTEDAGMGADEEVEDIAAGRSARSGSRQAAPRQRVVFSEAKSPAWVAIVLFLSVLCTGAAVMITQSISKQQSPNKFARKLAETFHGKPLPAESDTTGAPTPGQ